MLRHAWGKLGQNECLLAKSCTHVRIRYYALEHTHMECYVVRSSLALAHRHTHVGCYVLRSSLAPCNIRNATLTDLMLHLRTHTHTGCYVVISSLAGTQQIDRFWNHLKRANAQPDEEPHWD